MNRNMVFNDSPSPLISKDVLSHNSHLTDTNTPTQPKLIGKGSYGCIYNPHVNCSSNFDTDSTQKTSNIKYISKIQVLTKDQLYSDYLKSIKEDSQEFIKLNLTGGVLKETLFGQIIQSIPQYYMYFSPILVSCPIDINILSLEEINKCDIFDETHNSSISKINQYVNSKIQYIEGTSLSDYFKEILKKQPRIFVKQFIQTYHHLMKSIALLQKGPDSTSIVIHYDLKDNNIIFDTKRGIPIIIDFGLSFSKKALFEFDHPKILKDIFYIYYETYAPWCIDIVILSYITQNILLKAGDDSINEIYEKGKVNVTELKQIVEQFINNNEILKWLNGLSEFNELNTKMKNQWYSYIDSFEGKSWKDFIIDLRQRYVLWDTYSVSICFLNYLRDLNVLNGNYEMSPPLKQMIQYLVRIFEKNAVN